MPVTRKTKKMLKEPAGRLRYLAPEEGVARLSLAPRAVRCGVPQGAQFIRGWGDPLPFDLLLSTKAMKKG